MVSNHVTGFKVQRFTAKFVERAYLSREAKKVLITEKTLDTTNVPTVTANPHDPLLLIQYSKSVCTVHNASQISIRGHVQQSREDLRPRSKQ